MPITGMLQSQGGLSRIVARLRYRKRPFLGHNLGQGFSLDKLHHQEMQAAGLVGIVRGDDMGMSQPSGQFHFPAKSLHRAGANRSALD